MRYRHQSIKERVITLLIALSMLFAPFVPAMPVQAATNATAATVQAATTVSLSPTDDARTQPGSPDTNFEAGFLWVGQPDIHFSLLKFDLSLLPIDATINGAILQLSFTGAYTGTNEVEVGRVDGSWDEATLTGSTPVTYSWSGQFKTVTSNSKTDGSSVEWDVTPLVQSWHSGATVNDGLALRGNGGELKAAYSKETGAANDRGPKLMINYSLPAEDGQPRPDLGDAPDSSNHHGQNNTAYPGAGVLGQFPTVWEVPAGQVAGPRHANQSMEGWLGNFLSRENEADLGPDQDTPRNNILRNISTGAIADVADNDRADDGWRNRTIKFFNCQRQTLDMRISKGANATRNTMYLNVWFDGNRDGDWADLGQCQASEEEPAQARYEWIVQNYIIDMSIIPAGGAYDFAILTEKVLNDTPSLPHWMRFTLSEEPAVQPAVGGLPDGRGPHPTSPLGAFQFGETEDVLQKPAPAGQDGELILQKRVLTEESPVNYAGTATYEIQLRHEGGSQPIQAQIRDVLAYPLHLLPQVNGSGDVVYIDVSSATGGAAPLQADLAYSRNEGQINQVVSWQGTLEPNAEINLRFTVHVHPLCSTNQQTKTITNVAQARPKDGTAINAEATFTAKCPGYDPSNIQIDPEPLTDLIDLTDLSQLQWRGTIRNSHAGPVTLGAVFEPNMANGSIGAAAESATVGARLLDRITLAANETRLVNLDLRMETVFTDELRLAEDVEIGGNLSFCFLEDESTSCPDAIEYPNLFVNAPPVVVQYRPHDLGDAPDSTNHAGTNMAAYAGVQANFPTVFDAATGLPEGPQHRYPRPFHLGQQVSLEAEADLGPDQDPLNNLVPAANDPDNDRGDDGTNLALWTLNNCQTANLPVRITIAPQAVNYFQNLGTPGYLNIWLDGNRDGDWADATQCGQQPAVEHIVIDFPINVVGLGAGLHTINVPTGLLPWPATDKPAWVRLTLSERPANKTLAAGALTYGDGRGYPTSFKLGETEDYLYRSIDAGGGPDLDLQMSARTRKVTADEAALHAAAVDQLGNFKIQEFQIEIKNKGIVPAEGALLEFQIPEKLQGQRPALLRTPGIPSTNIIFEAGKVSMRLPKLEQGNFFPPIVMGWIGCLTCTVASNVTAAGIMADYTGIATVTADGDIDTSNNQRSATAHGVLMSPIIGAFMDYNDAACTDRLIRGRAVTNQQTVTLQGKGEPNQIIAILIGLTKVTEVTSNAKGEFQHIITLTDGLHEISAHNVTSPRDPASGLATGKLQLLVNSALAYDPMSSCFVDEHGRSYSLPTLGGFFGRSETVNWLQPGERYQVSLNANGDVPNQSLRVIFNDLVISSLLDPDQDGTFVGEFTMPNSLQAAAAMATNSLGVIVGSAGNQISYSSEINSESSGVITDQSTGQPVANATVSLLVAQDTDDGSTYFTAAQSDQGNPQVTATNGTYSYGADDGLYRVDVVADGYQPYRTTTIDVALEALNRTIALSPAIAENATETVYITANGFAPATLTVTPGTIIEFVNVALTDHGAEGNGWDSGLLSTGQGYKVKMTETGTFTYTDPADALTQGQLIVDSSTPAMAYGIYLPLIQR